MANSNIETFITTYGSSLPQQQKELLRAAADYFDSQKIEIVDPNGLFVVTTESPMRA